MFGKQGSDAGELHTYLQLIDDHSTDLEEDEEQTQQQGAAQKRVDFTDIDNQVSIKVSVSDKDWPLAPVVLQQGEAKKHKATSRKSMDGDWMLS